MNTRHKEDAISVGRTPVMSRLDPSGEILVVANRDSNDVAVVRVNAEPPNLLTMVPVGSRPTDVAVLLF